jgi:hypothetical protein
MQLHGSCTLVAVLSILGLLGQVESAAAQRQAPSLPTPELFAITPNGGKAGTTVEVTLLGVDLDGPDHLLFSHPGIKAEPVPTQPPAAPDPKKPAPPVRRRRGQPPAMTTGKFKVTIPADTPLGIHDVRVVNEWGISNPRAFVVGDLAEVAEREPNDDLSKAQRVELNTTISGAIATPTDVDYYVIAGKRGQRAIVSCLTSSIDSRLVAALELYDSSGRQLAFNRHYNDNDALLDYTLPTDGDYYVRLHEFTHTLGSPEHFYRLSISTAPWIDAVVPAVMEPGKSTDVTIYGRNLPGGQLDPTAIENDAILEKLTVRINVPSDPAARQRLAYSGHISAKASGLDGFEYRIRNPSGWSNPVLLTYARAPVVMDNEANDTPETAQQITVPCEIFGRIEKRHDRDWYTFTAKKGAVYNIEVFSDRLDSPTDMYFVLRNADTKQELVNLDENPDVLSPVQFYTRSDDPPAYQFVVPADGKYQLLVASQDADIRAGPRLFYQVRITPAQPDFRLIVMPAEGYRPEGCCIRQGGEQNYTALVWRQEGFNGPVTITTDGLPQGITCPPQILGPSVKETYIVLSAAANVPEWTGEIKLKGTAVINGQTVIHEARPASITWPVLFQSGVPAISRLDRNLMLAVREQAPFKLTATPDKAIAFQGKRVNVAIKLNRLWPDFKVPLQVGPIDVQSPLAQSLVFNNNNQPIPVNKDTATAFFEIRPNVPPGTYNLVLRGTAQIPFNKDPKAKQKAPVFVMQPSTAFTLTVLPNQVANVGVNNGNPTIKAGATFDLLVRVTRMNEYLGEFKVELVLPPNVKGVSADPVVIPAGKDEAKLVLKVPADAAVGSKPELVIRATATLAGNTPLAQEMKINVNVVK